MFCHEVFKVELGEWASADVAEANKKYFYQLDGEGIRYEIVAFAKAVTSGKPSCYITDEVSISIASVIDKFEHKEYIRLG